MRSERGGSAPLFAKDSAIHLMGGGGSEAPELSICSLFLILHAWAKKSTATKTNSPEVSNAMPSAREPRSPAA